MRVSTRERTDRQSLGANSNWLDEMLGINFNWLYGVYAPKGALNTSNVSNLFAHAQQVTQ